MRNNQDKYSYVCHPANFPLQLNGNSKKRVSSLNKADFNENKCTLDQQAKNLILKKLQNRIEHFSQRKSVLPLPERLSRPSSIKTFKNNKENITGSGVQYLIQKTENTKPSTHKQKAHISAITLPSQKVTEKKHFIIDRQSQNKEKLKRQIRHQQTANIKLNQDIYSNPYRREKQLNISKKIETNSLFKRSVDLGYEESRQKQVSDSKMIEIMGSQHIKIDKNINQKARRQDWRISNVF